jgi:predicted short-subunit dehydrogenase-like oxidoreductase (DUF2520 family)
MDAAELAKTVQAAPIDSTDHFNKDTEILFLCIRDSAIAEAASQWSPVIDKNCLLLHTSGTISSGVLQSHHQKSGVWYPLQTFTKKMETKWEGIPVYITAEEEDVFQTLEQIARHCGAIPVRSGDDSRQKIHTAAVIVNNFVNHLLSLTLNYCEKEKLDYNHLLPLLEQTIAKSKVSGPLSAQTGPARRKDLTTIEKHLQSLAYYPELQKIYRTMTESILKMYDK